jgi:DNA-binding SARP family transcriptional activator
VQRLGPLARPGLRTVEEAAGPTAVTARRLLSVVPSTPQHALRIEVLGRLRLVRDGVEVDEAHLRRVRVRQLLGYLVVHRQASRQQLTGQLWPDLGEADAARNLRVTLNYVQRVLEPARDERDAPFFLRAKGNQLELVDDPSLQVDLRAFERDLDEAARAEVQGAPSLALAAYLRAGDRYGGDLLAGTEADGWLELERDRVRRRCLRAVLRAGQLLLAAGQPERAEDVALRALSVDDSSEEAHRVMVAALLGQGDRAAAQRALDRLFDTLAELDLAASPASFDLAEQLRGRAGAHRAWP